MGCREWMCGVEGADVWGWREWMCGMEGADV